MSKPILGAILSCAGKKLTDEEKYIFSSANPLGIALFSRNIESKKQVKKLVEEIKNVINRDDVLIAIDAEGGRVNRLNTISKQLYVSAETLGKSPVEYCKIHAELISAEMRELGLNVNFAPIVETKETQQSQVLEGRCFNEDIDKIIKYAKKMADTYINSGICPCIKHLPGHFDMMTDPHLQAAVIDISKEEIKEKISYLKEFNQYPLAMTSHITLKQVDNTFPVSMSKKCITSILRNYLEFDNMLISDAIDMHALKGSIAERAEKCWNAGLDVICYCSGKTNDLRILCQKGRFMNEKSLIRFDKIKKIIHNTPEPINKLKLKQKYNKKFIAQKNTLYQYDATEVLNKMLEQGENI
ncbi:MAG: glycoside hydrolase family 3 protein [Alphaproteobacteria bacterium]|nr:glycoside hydrolase family 3 protein [Alphaproteobacteria bacterium]